MTNPMLLTHTNDPEESRLAAINLSGGIGQQVMHAVVTLLEKYGPMTPDELSDAYYRGRLEHPEWPLVKLHTVNKRVSEAKLHVGVLIKVGTHDGAQLLNLVDNPQSAHVAISNYWKKDAA